MNVPKQQREPKVLKREVNKEAKTKMKRQNTRLLCARGGRRINLQVKEYKLLSDIVLAYKKACYPY